MFKRPLLDLRNPCYSPSETASSFLENISGSFVGPPASRDQYLLSFLARLIYPSYGIMEDLLTSSKLCDTAHSLAQEFPRCSEGPSSDDNVIPFSPTLGIQTFRSLSMQLPNVPVKRRASLLDNNRDAGLRSSVILGMSLGKRKYASISTPSTTFSDLCGSSKRIRSSLTLNQSSFEVMKADQFVDLNSLARLNWSCSDESELIFPKRVDPISLVNCDDSLALVRESSLSTSSHAAIAPQSSQFLDLLKTESLWKGTCDEGQSLQSVTLQVVVDGLEEGGPLDAHLFDTLGKSPIGRLDLQSFFSDQLGFNPRKLDGILQVFRNPDKFRYLSALSLENISLHDDDLLCIHHLPSLSDLNLNCTGIGDVGVFYLVTLRRTLTTLMLRANKLITDGAVPALFMTGLRLLTPFSGHLFLDVPTNCEVYLDSLHTQYILSPLPPLITRPEAVHALELMALRRNLSAHAMHNPEISTKGGKEDLCARLVELLERRRGDLAVREMVWRSRDPEESTESSDEFSV
ncbi:hypothetical protein B0F90DRAFT_1786431 [Multifurca ochricompacta]|uniref:Uncharacterized protein n=1 Tax=Multifurca ochricompacta TaxID=376703 RepID=A0AAD4LWN2_9AGAM|nr:hypothetical protein B0F90DRAFT_1786431 [Multifurca ochricompacta]